MKNIPYNEISVSSKIDDEAEIISALSKKYASAPHAFFSFLNIYKELPVANDGMIFSINSMEIIFKASLLQLAAIHQSMETIIHVPALNTNILGKVVYVDAKHRLVSLKDFSYAEVHFTKRSAVRVRHKVPMNVKLTADSANISGVIRDISLTGCRVTTPAGFLFEKAGNITLLLKYICDGQFMELQIKARLLRITGGPMYECVLLFEHTDATEKDLSLYIYQRQVEILRELKEWSN